jgi:hypothetical protein
MRRVRPTVWSLAGGLYGAGLGAWFGGESAALFHDMHAHISRPAFAAAYGAAIGLLCGALFGELVRLISGRLRKSGWSANFRAGLAWCFLGAVHGVFFSLIMIALEAFAGELLAPSRIEGTDIALPNLLLMLIIVLTVSLVLSLCGAIYGLVWLALGGGRSMKRGACIAAATGALWGGLGGLQEAGALGLFVGVAGAGALWALLGAFASAVAPPREAKRSESPAE